MSLEKQSTIVTNFNGTETHKMSLRTISGGFKSVKNVRNYATKPYEVFDRSLKKLQKSRMALNPQSEQVEYLRNEIAKRAIERLAFIKRSFPRVLDLGSHSGNFENELFEGQDEDTKLVRDKIGEILMIDGSKESLHRWDDKPFSKGLTNLMKVVCDEEELKHELLSKTNQFDAVISNLSLHWVNELPLTLAKINGLLKPDGLFLGSMICEDSIFELRTSLQLAELERHNGMSMGRISPMIKVDDMTSLLKMARFNMVTIDVEEIVVHYPNIFAIMEDLQLMGENNANRVRPDALSKETLISTQAIYQALHGEEDGALPLTYRVMFMIGWKESESQPKPLQRGTGGVNLKDILN